MFEGWGLSGRALERRLRRVADLPPLARRLLRGACFFCGEGGHYARHAQCPNGWREEPGAPVPAAPVPAAPVPPSAGRPHNPAEHAPRPRGVYWYARGRYWRYTPPRSGRQRTVSVLELHSPGQRWGVEIGGVVWTFETEAQGTAVAGALAVELARDAGSARRRVYVGRWGPQRREGR